MRTLGEKVIQTEQKQFVGRRDEQELFTNALDALISLIKETNSPLKDKPFKRIFLLYGEGGMGKTTLTNRFVQIAESKKCLLIKIDWDEHQSEGSISSSTRMMDVIYAQFVKEGQGGDLKSFREIRLRRDEVAERVNNARKEFDPLVSAVADGLSTLTQTGTIGKQVIEVVTHTLAGELAKREEQFAKWLKQKLDPRDFEIYQNSQLELSKGLVKGIAAVAATRPTIIVFDTYELVGRFDSWVRKGLIYHGSDQLIYVIAGRYDLSADYLDLFPQAFVAPIKLNEFRRLDIRDYLLGLEIPVTEEIVAQVKGVTRGVPLAVKIIAEAIRGNRADIQTAFGEMINIPLMHDDIIGMATKRFLKYCMNREDDPPDVLKQKQLDRRHIYALAVLREYSDPRQRIKVLKAIWDQEMENLDGEKVAEILNQLGRNYSFVFSDERQMHPVVRDFIRSSLQDGTLPYGGITDCNLRAYQFFSQSRANIKGLDIELYRDKQWQQLTLNCLNHLLWINEAEAMRFLANHFIKAMQYSRAFRDELLALIVNDEVVFSRLLPEHKQVIWALEQVTQWSYGGEQEFQASQSVMQLLSKWLDRQEKILECIIRTKRLATRGKASVRSALQVLEESEQLCENPTELNKDRAEAYAIVGAALIDFGKLNQALPLLEKAVFLDENNKEAQARLGYICYRRAEFDKAVEKYHKALDIEPNYGYALKGLKEVETTLTDIRSGQRTIPLSKLSKALVIEGNVLSNRGLLEEAVKKYRRASELSPDYTESRIKLANVLRQLGKYEEALEILQYILQYITDDRFDLQARYLDALASVSRQRGNFSDAIAHYKSALAKDPYYANAYYGLGKTYLYIGDYLQAIRFSSRSLLYNHDAYWVMNIQGIARICLGQQDEAQRNFNRATTYCKAELTRHPHAYDAHYHLGIALIGIAEPNEALLAFRAATSICHEEGLLQEVISDLELLKGSNKSLEAEVALSFLRNLL